MVYLRLCFAMLWLTCLACSHEEPALDNFEQHLCSLATDISGRATTLLLDNGTRLPITNTVRTNAPSDTLRVLAYFVRTADGRAQLGNTRIVITRLAPTAPTALPQATAPMQVITLWRSSHFVNLRLNVRTHSEVPTFALTRDTLQANADGTQVVTLHVYRPASNALAAYTHTYYLSIDLRPLATTLTAGRDSIALVIHTSNDNTPSRTHHTMLY